MLHPYTQYTLLLLYDYCIISLFAEAALHVGQVPMLVFYKSKVVPKEKFALSGIRIEISYRVHV